MIKKITNKKKKKCQTQRCMRFLFSQPIIVFPLLRGKLCPKYSRSTQKSVRYNKCPL